MNSSDPITVRIGALDEHMESYSVYNVCICLGSSTVLSGTSCRDIKGRT